MRSCNAGRPCIDPWSKLLRGRRSWRPVPVTACFASCTAAEWAVRGLTRTAALELGRDRLRVNSVHPGVVSTPFIHDPVPGSDVTIADAYSPDALAIPRLAQPQEVTDMLLWLTSREAGFVTGAEFVVDGGLLLGPALPAQEQAQGLTQEPVDA